MLFYEPEQPKPSTISQFMYQKREPVEDFAPSGKKFAVKHALKDTTLDDSIDTVQAKLVSN